MYYNVILYFCRQLKDKYMYMEHQNSQQNVPELLKAILHKNSNVFRGGSASLFQEQGNQLVNCFLNYFIMII